MGVKITICTRNVWKTPKTHMKHLILAGLYQFMKYVVISITLLLVKTYETSIARKYPYLGQKWGSKLLFAPVMSEKHLKHIWNLYISRLISIYGIRWNIYHKLLVKVRNFYCQEIPFLCQRWGSKWLFEPVMSEKQLKHMWNTLY